MLSARSQLKDVFVIIGNFTSISPRITGIHTMLLLFLKNAYHGSHRFVYNASSVRDPEPPFCLYTAFFFSQYVCSVCWPDKCWPNIFRSEWTDQTYSMQVDTVPNHSFYVIKLHVWKHFFLHPLEIRERNGGSSFWTIRKWWDHRSQKGPEHHPVRVHLSMEP